MCAALNVSFSCWHQTVYLLNECSCLSSTKPALNPQYSPNLPLSHPRHATQMCGWAQGCHTADVDALLFGAVTVYRTLSLHTAQPKSTQMARCRRAAVQRRLGLQSGGTQVGGRCLQCTSQTRFDRRPPPQTAR
jgi:hypothetical protein